MWCRAGLYRNNKWKTQQEREENNEPPPRGTPTRTSKTHERPLFCVNNHVHIGRLACSLDALQTHSLIQPVMLKQYNCTGKEMHWFSGVGARRRKSDATLAFPDAETCFCTIAASVSSQRAQWPRSQTAPSLSSAGRQLQIRLLSTSKNHRKPPFTPPASLTGSLLHLNSAHNGGVTDKQSSIIPLTATPSSPLKPCCDTLICAAHLHLG